MGVKVFNIRLRKTRRNIFDRTRPNVITDRRTPSFNDSLYFQNMLRKYSTNKAHKSVIENNS